jgi:hypothetical protein
METKNNFAELITKHQSTILQDWVKEQFSAPGTLPGNCWPLPARKSLRLK